MTRGVAVLAIGKKAYMYFAINMIASIKHFSPDLEVNLIADPDLLQYASPYLRKWDYFTPISREHCYDKEGKFQPGKAKVNLYDYYWKGNDWDECVYLDIDGICIRDIDPLFAENCWYKTQKDSLHWANDDDIRKAFDIKKDVILNGLNSSYQYVKKCDEAKQLYKIASEAMETPLDLKDQTNNWFNMQPDELYYAVGMAKMGVTEPYNTNPYPIYFRPRSETKAPVCFSEVEEKHYVIGCYGGERYNHRSVAKYYDKLCQRIHIDVFKQNNPYKFHFLMGLKHEDFRRYRKRR